MKPPRPNEGIAKHSWGKRRRIAKKTEKGLWKAMHRLGLITKGGRLTALKKPAIMRSNDGFWVEERIKGGKREYPQIWVCLGTQDYWGKADETTLANYYGSYLDDKAGIWADINEDTGWPTKRSHESPRHALQLLRAQQAKGE